MIWLLARLKRPRGRTLVGRVRPRQQVIHPGIVEAVVLGQDRGVHHGQHGVEQAADRGVGGFEPGCVIAARRQAEPLAPVRRDRVVQDVSAPVEEHRSVVEPGAQHHSHQQSLHAQSPWPPEGLVQERSEIVDEPRFHHEGVRQFDLGVGDRRSFVVQGVGPAGSLLRFHSQHGAVRAPCKGHARPRNASAAARGFDVSIKPGTGHTVISRLT